MQGFTKVTYGNERQILFNVGADVNISVGVVAGNTGIDANTEGKKIIKAGTPMHGDLTNRTNAFLKAGQTVDPTATATVSGTGITAATVTASTFKTAVSNVTGTYVFTADVSVGTTWSLGGETVELVTYGISVTGTAEDGDKITVVFTAEDATPAVGVLLHDVDVTGGNNNATLLIDGFVDLNKLDEDVLEPITSTVRSQIPHVRFLK